MDGALWSSAAEVLAIRDERTAHGRHGAMRGSATDYGAYSDLVLPVPQGRSLSDELRAEAINQLQMRLASNGSCGEHSDNDLPQITNFDHPWYTKSQLDRLARWWDIESGNPMGLSAASQAEMADARVRISFAFELLAEAAPELLGETAAILDEIVVAAPDGSQRFDYAAGSSFALWGAMVVNAAMHPGWQRYCKSIVHEAGHNLLFAMARDEPVVLNDPLSTYTSPVRDDPRPMDGIFHAAFVAARESYAFDRLLSWHDRTLALSDEDVSQVSEILETSVITFWQCHEVLVSDAQLSDLGGEIIRDCVKFMKCNFALVTQ